MKNETINMNISYDAKAKAMYVQFSSNKIAKTIELKEGHNVDLDSKGSLVGIEILNPNGKLGLELAQINNVFNAPQFRTFKPNMITEAINCIAKSSRTESELP